MKYGLLCFVVHMIKKPCLLYFGLVTIALKMDFEMTLNQQSKTND